MPQDCITGIVVDPAAVGVTADALDAMRDVRAVTSQADKLVKDGLASLKKRGGEVSDRFKDLAPAERGQAATVATRLFDLVLHIDQISDDAEKELGRALGDLSEWTRNAAKDQTRLDEKIAKEMEQ
jgi:hypothetical protein